MVTPGPYRAARPDQGEIGPYLWLVVGAFFSTSAALFLLRGFRIVGGQWPSLAIDLSSLAIAAHVLRRSRSNVARKCALALTFMLCSLIVTGSGTMLVYASATSGRPLADASLSVMDRLIGYDWRWYSSLFLEDNAITHLILSSYIWIFLVPFLVIVTLVMVGTRRCLERYILAIVVSLIVTNAVFALYPATTAWIHEGLSYAEIARYRLPQADGGWIGDLLAIRQGGGRVLHGIGGSGLVAFPSFHCASALLFVWATWRVRLMRPAMLALNGLMILATPIAGGHYLVDLLGGGLVALLSIYVVETLHPRLAALRTYKWRADLCSATDAGLAGSPARL